MRPTLHLDVWSDIACPWCFIGKRRLEAAIAQRPNLAVEVRYRAFELRPELPAEGVERGEFYRQMFGSEEALQRALARVRAEGDTADISFAFEEMPRAPNTRLAHRALEVVRSRDGEVAQAEAKERLFEAFFVQAQDVTDPLVVASVTGVEPAGDDGTAEVEADELLARQLGIRGVPFYVADRRLAVSGAQPVEYFLQFLDRAEGAAAAA